ncbi:MAG: OmpH family outer membrane protein [Candidatus Sericytochromatia bacterium]|nr:OmpH family outer membrane protein [Candidatus Tanganyikabacteria bacterium]
MSIHRLLAASVALSLLVASPAFAASSLAMVDTKRLFEQFKGAQSSQGEFKRKAEAYQKEFLEKNRQLQEMQREGKSKAEIDKMTKKFEAELKPKKDAVERLDKEMSGRLKKQIEAAISDVAKTKGFAVVVDKQIVLFGGEDITDDVLDKLNK